jgi:hypothetical protein
MAGVAALTPVGIVSDKRYFTMGMGQHDSGSQDGTPAEGQTYDAMLQLDEMESLAEEIEEAGLPAGAGMADLPPELAARMSELGVRTMQELRERIRRMHQELDMMD